MMAFSCMLPFSWASSPSPLASPAPACTVCSQYASVLLSVLLSPVFYDSHSQSCKPLFPFSWSPSWFPDLHPPSIYHSSLPINLNRLLSWFDFLISVNTRRNKHEWASISMVWSRIFWVYRWHDIGCRLENPWANSLYPWAIMDFCFLKESIHINILTQEEVRIGEHPLWAAHTFYFWFGISMRKP